MANNNPGNPWDKKPGQQPDIEEFLNALQQKFKMKFGKNPFNYGVLAAIAFIIWLGSGIFIVDPQEQAAVLRFGKLSRIVGPGPNYHMPFPIEKVYLERVTEVKRLEIGFRTLNPGPPPQYRRLPKESLMLTGDESIVNVEFSVQYLISDLANYLFNAVDVHNTVRLTAESAMREVIGQNKIDTVMTEGKAGIELATKELLSSILRSYKVGVSVQNVKLQDVQPPENVAEAFKSVASAREERERLINEAEGYANDLLPRAKGEAEQMLNKAKAYAVTRVNISKGEADRFVALLSEYRKAEKVTRDRILIETMEEVLPGVNKVIVDGSIGGNVYPILPLNQGVIPKTPGSAESAGK